MEDADIIVCGYVAGVFATSYLLSYYKIAKGDTLAFAWLWPLVLFALVFAMPVYLGGKLGAWVRKVW